MFCSRMLPPRQCLAVVIAAFMVCSQAVFLFPLSASAQATADPAIGSNNAIAKFTDHYFRSPLVGSHLSGKVAITLVLLPAKADTQKIRIIREDGSVVKNDLVLSYSDSAYSGTWDASRQSAGPYCLVSITDIAGYDPSTVKVCLYIDEAANEINSDSTTPSPSGSVIADETIATSGLVELPQPENTLSLIATGSEAEIITEEMETAATSSVRSVKLIDMPEISGNETVIYAECNFTPSRVTFSVQGVATVEYAGRTLGGNRYSFTWPLGDYSHGQYIITVKAISDQEIQSDRKTVLFEPLAKTEPDTEEMAVNPPLIIPLIQETYVLPLMGQVEIKAKVEEPVEEMIFQVQGAGITRKYAGTLGYAGAYYFIWPTTEFPDGEYVLEAAAFIRGKIVGENKRILTIRNQEQHDEVFDPAADTESVSVSPAQDDFDQAALAELAGDGVSPECIAAGIMTLTRCQMYTELPPECRRHGLTTEVECHEYILDELMPAIDCSGIDQGICRSTVEKKYMSAITAKQEVYDHLKVINDNSARSLDEWQSQPGMTEIQPALGDRKVKLRLCAVNPALIIRSDGALVQTAPRAMIIDNDSDGLGDDTERRIGTDPYLADTDNDGFSDGEEAANGYDPLGPGLLETVILAPAEQAMITGQSLEQPIAGGPIGRELAVVSLESDAGAAAIAYRIAGRAMPDTVLSLFIYSDLPLVIMLKADHQGNWQYELSSALAEGEHEAYLAINDATGKLVKKSQPFGFLVKEARAVTLDESAAPIPDSAAIPAPQRMMRFYILLASGIILAGIIFFIGFYLLRHEV